MTLFTVIAILLVSGAVIVGLVALGLHLMWCAERRRFAGLEALLRAPADAYPSRLP